MAGSMKYFVYSDDVGGLHGYKADESNSEIFGTAHDANLGVPKYTVPQNLRPRRANYASTTSVRTKSIVVPTKALYDDLASGSQTAVGLSFIDDTFGETFNFVGLTPETIKPVVIPLDTGLTDGDIS